MFHLFFVRHPHGSAVILLNDLPGRLAHASGIGDKHEQGIGSASVIAFRDIETVFQRDTGGRIVKNKLLKLVCVFIQHGLNLRIGGAHHAAALTTVHAAAGAALTHRREALLRVGRPGRTAKQSENKEQR